METEMARKSKAKKAFEQLNPAQRDRIWLLANDYQFGPGRPPRLPVELGLVDRRWTKLTALGKAVARLCPAVV